MASRLVAVLSLLLVAAAAQAATPPRVTVPGDRVVTISVVDVDPTHCCTEPAQIRIRRESDGAIVGVRRLGVDRQVTDLPANLAGTTATTRIHALLESPLVPGHRYAVTLQPLGIEVVSPPTMATP